MKASADQGNPIAQYEIGYFYLMGFGVPKDEAAAVEAVRGAADMYYAPAQVFMGHSYANGMGGLEVDYAKAKQCFALAAEQGDPDGQYCLGLFYYMGRGTEVDKAEARKWLEAAAAQGDENAIAFLENDFVD